MHDGNLMRSGKFNVITGLTITCLGVLCVIAPRFMGSLIVWIITLSVIILGIYMTFTWNDLGSFAAAGMVLVIGLVMLVFKPLVRTFIGVSAAVLAIVLGSKKLILFLDQRKNGQINKSALFSSIIHISLSLVLLAITFALLKIIITATGIYLIFAGVTILADSPIFDYFNMKGEK